MNTQTPDYERFAHNWSKNRTSTKLALGFDYDEKIITRLKSPDWSETHTSYEPDYQFNSGREGAWAVDADTQTLATVRERTGLSVPPASECPINARPFPDGSSSLEIVTRSLSSLSYECHRCGSDGVLSALEYEKVYKRTDGLATELLLDPDSEATHICTSCRILLSAAGVPDDRDLMGKAMGEPSPTQENTP